MSLPATESGFTLKKNKFYTCTTTTDAAKVAKLVTAIHKAFADGTKKQIVYILTGTHGNAAGELVRERKFYWSEDKNLETMTFKAVDVFNFSQADGKIVKSRWERYINAHAILIFAWCYSEQARTGWMQTNGLKVV